MLGREGGGFLRPFVGGLLILTKLVDSGSMAKGKSQAMGVRELLG
jgi:hypothetical protein